MIAMSLRYFFSSFSFKCETGVILFLGSFVWPCMDWRILENVGFWR
jgi:hypothetical protein